PFFFSSRRRHTRFSRDWSSDVCSSDLDLTKGALVVPVLNAIGFAAHALGNHEFDYGQDTLRARMRQLTAPVLGANVTYADGRDRSEERRVGKQGRSVWSRSV